MMLTRTIFLFFRFAAATFFFGALLSMPASSSDDAKAKMTDFYVQFAYGSHDRITKFAQRPRINFICSLDGCDEAIDRIQRHFPERNQISQLNSALSDAEIQIVLGSKNDLSKLGRLSQSDWPTTAVSEKFEYRKCYAIRIRDGYEILHVTVSSEGDDGSSEACVLYSLLHTSGGNFTDDFDMFLNGIQNGSDEDINAIYRSFEFLLRMHWAGLIKPGTPKEEARALIIKYIE